MINYVAYELAQHGDLMNKLNPEIGPFTQSLARFYAK